jgi:hypothetical protein
MGALK